MNHQRSQCYSSAIPAMRYVQILNGFAFNPVAEMLFIPLQPLVYLFL